MEASEEATRPAGVASGVMISQGAEARIYKCKFLQRDAIVKERFKKSYRHPVLDAKLTLRRMNGEARCLARAAKLGVAVPAVYHLDYERHAIVMEHVEGVSVKQHLLQHAADEAAQHQLAIKIGVAVARLQDGGIVHGDLTTSNMILRAPGNDLVLIDFGLAQNSTLPEDKAVDLYVLDRALSSLHTDCPNMFQWVLDAYKKHSKNWCPVTNKFAEGVWT
eukprot:jgi/Mesvir1/21672/Mv04093-RA.1